MDFLLLTAGSLVAIFLLRALTAWMFPQAQQLTPERAQRHLGEYAPDCSVTETFLTSDNQHAVLSLAAPSAAIGLASLLGDRVVARMLTAADIERATWNNETLTLSLRDFTQPSLILPFSAQTKASVTSLLAGILERPEDVHAA